MIAKIGKGANMIGAISYNLLKVHEENGHVLLTNKIPEVLNDNYTTAFLNRYFEPYLLANNKTEKPVRHISLNPDPADKVSDEQFRNIAEQYMQEMGYGNQPYVVFKHTDIERTHIHILTTCVDYTKGDIKSQIASVTRHLPKYYQYQSLGAYNALLSLFNITSEEVKGELHGQPKQGLVYFALNEYGQKASNPFKSSLFGKEAGMTQLEKHFEKSKENMKTNPAKEVLKNTIEAGMHTSNNETDFKKQLLEQGINTVVRRNDEGRIYGMTFIDHESRTVWNGSQLGKNLSANVFNKWWDEQAIENRKQTTNDNTTHSSRSSQNHTKEESETPHELFDFLNKEQPAYNEPDLIEGLGSLLPDVQDEDYEEQEFANRMKTKRKRKRGK